jgi:segregation and condensation protein B
MQEENIGSGSKGTASAANQENIRTTAEQEPSRVADHEAETESSKTATEVDGYTGPQTDAQLMAAIEAILFTMGESVDIAAMAKALNRSNKEINCAIDSLTEKYSAEDSGIMIQRFDEAVQMSTRPDQYQNLIRIAKVPKKITLSDSVIETLSIIAYKQPITKAEVEEIRGVSSDYALNKLLDYDLVKELGRKDAPGRPILFGTTEQFLRSFGVRNLSELPALNKIKVEEFKQEAEEEVDTKLGI